MPTKNKKYDKKALGTSDGVVVGFSGSHASVSRNSQPSNDQPSYDDYLINNTWTYKPKEQKLYRSGREIKLRSKTAHVLDLMIAHQQTVVTAQLFFDKVWCDKYVSENVLKQSILELRTAFEDSNKTIIKTVPKKGYLLSATLAKLPSVDDQLQKQRAVDNDSPHTTSSSTSTLSKSDRASSQKRVNRYAIKSILSGYREKKLLLLFLFSFIVIPLSFGVKSWANLQDEHKKQQMLLAVMTASKDFYFDILRLYHSVPNDSKGILKSILDNAIAQVDGFDGESIAKLGKYKALYELYRVSGHYDQARLMISRMESSIVGLYGSQSMELIQNHFLAIDILIKLRRRNEAYHFAMQTLELTKEHFSDDSVLLAQSYYYAARGYLVCVEPFCNRAESIGKGEAYIRKALSLYRDSLPENSIEIADTLWLLNWFLWDAEEKIQLTESALSIYKKLLGDYHEKTAAAYEEYGRTIVFHKQQWLLGEKNLLKAMAVRNKLYPDFHPKIANIQGYLGEHYFMMQNYEKAITYISTATQTAIASQGEGNDNFLEDLLLMARSQLYTHKVEQAHVTINRAFEIIERYRLTPALILHRALKTTQLRIQLAMQQSDFTKDALLDAIQSTRDVFKSPDSVLIHEYHSYLMTYFPDQIDESYLHNIKLMLSRFNPKSRYLYLSDLLFIKDRALSLCKGHAVVSCESIKDLFKDFTPVTDA